MKPFRSLLFWLLLAALGALGATLLLADPGLVLVQIHGREIDTSVAVAVLALLIGFALLVLAWRLLTLPMNAWRGRRQRRSRVRLSGGLVALHEGRWRQAEEHLLYAAADRGLRVPALLNAARAAWARGDRGTAAAHLRALAEVDPVAAALAEADAALAAGREAEAAANLDALAQQAAMPPRGQLLRVQALAACGRAREAWGLLGDLRTSQVLPPDEFAALERRLAARILREAGDANALADAWNATPRALRSDPLVLAAYAERAGATGMQAAAAAAVGKALDAGWDESLAAVYADLPRSPKDDLRLGAAETWLRRHDRSPALLLTLARLERDRGRTAAALDYLHRALAQGAGAEAWEELGAIHADRGESEPARQCLANALRVLRGKPPMALPGRGLHERIHDEAVAEERDEHGMPRLRSE
ncbi:heme biosynthesis HemY N-terminal domain-containing protein [Coralloluteibacterium thermophilus]|uniref:Heme biosynthesis HemY N-terminal domain-containing protein n=1 Tax=Coralloluteibacterium thermophilum TaxID=2707049 RepID=A0ABV9NI98_9GAMM